MHQRQRHEVAEAAKAAEAAAKLQHDHSVAAALAPTCVAVLDDDSQNDQVVPKRLSMEELKASIELADESTRKFLLEQLQAQSSTDTSAKRPGPY